MKSAVLITLADKSYVDQAKQLFSSAYFNAGWQGDYMLLAHKIPEKDRKWFTDKGILVKKCEGMFSEKELENLYEKSPKKYSPEASAVMTDKLCIFAPEFKQWENIVFLDSDMIIRASIESLSCVNGFWAARDGTGEFADLGRQFLGTETKLIGELKIQYGMNLNKKSFNTGVMAFSTDIIEQDTFYKLKNIFKKYIKAEKFLDQGALNIFFYKKWRVLNISYNSFPQDSKLINPAVMHFIGQAKPWEEKNPYYQEWKKNLAGAEYINLKNIPRAAKKLAWRELFFSSLVMRIICFARLIYLPDRFIGQLGELLKRKYPKIYRLLKPKNAKN